MEKTEKPKAAEIKITENGPYIVTGVIPINKEFVYGDNHGFSKWGEKIKIKMGDCALCRCGESNDKIFCDGSHKKTGFVGKETSSRKKYSENADKIVGPDLILSDYQDLCFGAGFCHAKEGNTWELTRSSDNPKLKDIAIRQACDCPSGRLVAIDKKTGKPIEFEFKPSINIIEEPRKGVSGPIMVKGYVPIISSDGFLYEARNRVTLCRCGKSENKPFCDGTHTITGFNDKDESIY